MKEAFKHIKDDKEELCKERLEVARDNKSPKWTIKDINTATKHLKNNKSRDPYGHINELFHSDTAGNDLTEAITLLMNKIKFEQIFL